MSSLERFEKKSENDLRDNLSEVHPFQELG